MTSPIVQFLQIVTSSTINDEKKSERDSFPLELTGMTLCMVKTNAKARNAALASFIERGVFLC